LGICLVSKRKGPAVRCCYKFSFISAEYDASIEKNKKIIHTALNYTAISTAAGNLRTFLVLGGFLGFSVFSGLIRIFFLKFPEGGLDLVSNRQGAN